MIIGEVTPVHFAATYHQTLLSPINNKKGGDQVPQFSFEILSKRVVPSCQPKPLMLRMIHVSNKNQITVYKRCNIYLFH